MDHYYDENGDTDKTLDQFIQVAEDHLKSIEEDKERESSDEISYMYRI